MTETVSIDKCAYHPRRKAKIHCQSCDRPICDDDTWIASPLDSNEIEVCTECHEYFTGKDLPPSEKFKLRVFAAFVALVAIIGVTPAFTRLIWG